MSETTDFYLSWLGGPAFGTTPNIPKTVAPAPPVVFTPLDISDCYIWFNCDDTTQMSLDESNVVLSMANLGQAGSSAVQSTAEVSVVVDVNNLNCLSFPQGSCLSFTTSLPYLSRTQFVVFKSTSDMSGASYPYLTFISGGYSCMQTGVDLFYGNVNYAMCQQGINCPLLTAIDISNNPYNVPTLVAFVNSYPDLSYNAVYVNGGANANYSTDIGNLFDPTSQEYILNNPGPPGEGQSQVMCELIEYGRVLTNEEMTTITNYLNDKWKLGLKS